MNDRLCFDFLWFLARLCCSDMTLLLMLEVFILYEEIILQCKQTLKPSNTPRRRRLPSCLYKYLFRELIWFQICVGPDWQCLLVYLLKLNSEVSQFELYIHNVLWYCLTSSLCDGWVLLHYIRILFWFLHKLIFKHILNLF